MPVLGLYFVGLFVCSQLHSYKIAILFFWDHVQLIALRLQRSVTQDHDPRNKNGDLKRIMNSRDPLPTSYQLAEDNEPRPRPS